MANVYAIDGIVLVVDRASRPSDGGADRRCDRRSALLCRPLRHCAAIFGRRWRGREHQGTA